MIEFLDRLKQKVIVVDGAMGTMIQAYDLQPQDFDGLDGCNEYLVKTKPDIIKEIHAAYLEVGADVVMTNSFGSSRIVLAEYDIAEQAYELNKISAELAKEVANDYSSSSWPRYVSGSMGPTTKLVTLGHINFDDMLAAYLEQARGLIDGGVDLLQIETCQDILQLKCAVIASVEAMKLCKRKVPICTTITVETTGSMLVGTEITAALVVLETMPIDIVGLNCATGPDLMQSNIRFLGKTSSRPIAVLPNAGLPRNVGGVATYDLTPEALADYQEIFVKDYGVAMVGGCCGTTPAHIKELFDRVGSLSPRERPYDFDSHVASTYTAVPLDQEGSSPLIIGERCNANGSKEFREMLLSEDWEGMVEMARREVREGAHVLDVCTAYVGRDEVADMTQLISRYVTQVTAPLMIDSTQIDVLEATLKLIGGRPIINSINLEDGEDKLDKICELSVKFGAALIALTIDEEGMAKTAQRKLEVATRIYKLCTERHGIPPDAVIFDPLTFTIGSGDEDSRKSGLETLEAIKLIKKDLPKARTVLGLSNISFGLKPHVRQVLNSVFLAEALRHGLDSAIVHSKKILPISKIEPEILKVCEDLIFDRRTEDYDPLFVLIERMQGAKERSSSSNNGDSGTVEEVLKNRIIDGRKIGIDKFLEKALGKYSPVEIINSILLDGMKVVGDLFASGDMQLPFVLQSAETMKSAVAFLEPYMEKSEGPKKGCLVIATVKGDVHDIGKNLVDIILSNNGYKVVNLGIKQPIESIVEAIKYHKPDAVGMSGLLVKSTIVMKENLESLSQLGFNVPVICGGAALNRAFVEVDLKQAYTTGSVHYGADAFTGLKIMDELVNSDVERKLTKQTTEVSSRKAETRAEREIRVQERAKEYVRSETRILERIPEPPFWGVKYVEGADLPLDNLFPFLNKKALFANQWMYRRGKSSTKDYRAFLKSYVEPKLMSWCDKAKKNGWLQPKVAYGYFPCNADKNALVVFDPGKQDKELCRVEFPRQLTDKRRCIADYFLPLDSGRKDIVVFHVVTIGSIASEKCQELFKSNEYTDYLHFYGLSVETAEALAEYWHKQVRHELGIAGKDGPTIEALLRQNYHGERYSFGYPACPNLEDQKHIFELLKPDKIGVELTSEYQLVPEQSTSAIIVHHPEACYFSI